MSPSANINPTWVGYALSKGKPNNSHLTPGKKDHQQIGTRFPKHLRTTLGISTSFAASYLFLLRGSLLWLNSPFCFSSTKMKFRFSRESTWSTQISLEVSSLRSEGPKKNPWPQAAENVDGIFPTRIGTLQFISPSRLTVATTEQVFKWDFEIESSIFPKSSKVFLGASLTSIETHQNKPKNKFISISWPSYPFQFQKKNNQPAVDCRRPSRHGHRSRWRTFAAHSWRKDISKPPKCDLNRRSLTNHHPLTHTISCRWKKSCVVEILISWNFLGGGKFQQDSGNRISR